MRAVAWSTTFKEPHPMFVLLNQIVGVIYLHKQGNLRM